MTKFPQELDTDTELYEVADDETDVIAAHHNVLKEAVKAIEKKVGVNNSTDPGSLDSEKITSLPPDGLTKVEGIYLDEENKEIVFKT